MKSVSQSRGGDELQPPRSSMVVWNNTEQVGRSRIQNAMLEATGDAAVAHCKTPAGKVNTKTAMRDVPQIVWTYLRCSSSKAFQVLEIVVSLLQSSEPSKSF